MKQIAKLGVFLALVTFSTAASLKSSKIVRKSNEPQILAQTEAGCNIGSGKALDLGGQARGCLDFAQLEDGSWPRLDIADKCSCKEPVTPPDVPGEPPLEGPPPALGAGIIAAHGVSASASQLTETNIFDDHRCAS